MSDPEKVKCECKPDPGFFFVTVRSGPVSCYIVEVGAAGSTRPGSATLVVCVQFYSAAPKYPELSIPQIVLILEGNSEIGAHVGRHICNLICFEKFAHSESSDFLVRFCSMRAQHVLSYHLI